jgi:NAD(P)-dependent dehydrogenase (short-subunit alcohol dehydrogenase family)
MKSQTPREVEYLPASAAPPTPQRGSIANVASICGVTALGLAAYTPTKHAAIGITRNGAKFYGPLGVRVNAVCPGFTLTEMLQDVLGNEYTPGSKASEEHGLVPHVALRRFGLPEEQANVVSFLLSPESSFINGTHIINDGGFESVR